MILVEADITFLSAQMQPLIPASDGDTDPSHTWLGRYGDIWEKLSIFQTKYIQEIQKSGWLTRSLNKLLNQGKTHITIFCFVRERERERA